MNNQDNYSALAPYYDIFIDWPRRLATEIPFITGALPPVAENVRCLDIGCGTGRHLERLASEGMHPEGAEPSPHLRALAVRNLPGVTIHAAGMDRLGELAARHGPWGLVTCLGNTLPHLEPSLRPGFFSSLKTALAPGAVAVLHTLGYDRILRERPDGLPEKTVTSDGRRYTFRRLYEYRENSLVFILHVLENGRKLASQSEILYPITGDDIAQLCREAGLGKVAMYDGFDSSRPYTKNSGNLVCVVSR